MDIHFYDNEYYLERNFDGLERNLYNDFNSCQYNMDSHFNGIYDGLEHSYNNL